MSASGMVPKHGHTSCTSTSSRAAFSDRLLEQLIFSTASRLYPNAWVTQAHNTLQVSSAYSAHIRVIILLHWKERAQSEIMSNSMDLLLGPTNQHTIFMLQRSHFLVVKASNQDLEILPELWKKLLAQLLPKAQIHQIQTMLKKQTYHF